MIEFKECQTPGYKARTWENASADVTIAIAADFFTAGERLTRNCVTAQSNMYIAIKFEELNSFNMHGKILHHLLGHPMRSLNIAGNGIYTINMRQNFIDVSVHSFLATLLSMRESIGSPKPELIRSGGQTGIDEAGLKAAVKLGIPALCLAPKGWTFRDITGKDISDEHLFKARFK